VKKFIKLPWGQKDPLSSKSSSSIKGDSNMSAKPTTVTTYYLNGKEDTIECIYAKAVSGALLVATKMAGSERQRFKYIPFSNPNIDYIVVESEAKEEGRSSHSHDR
jgi:hypothetical protein